MGHEMCLLQSRLGLEWRGLLFGENLEMRGDSTDTTITDLSFLPVKGRTTVDASQLREACFALSISLCVAHVNPTHCSSTWFRIREPFPLTLTSLVTLYYNHTIYSIEPLTVVLLVNLSSNRLWVSREHRSGFILSILMSSSVILGI